jgi:hypothetical protein
MSENVPTDASTVPPPATLLQMMTGYWVSQALYVAAKLGVADLLADGPRRSRLWPRRLRPTPPRCGVCCAGRHSFSVCDPTQCAVSTPAHFASLGVLVRDSTVAMEPLWPAAIRAASTRPFS